MKRWIVQWRAHGQGGARSGADSEMPRYVVEALSRDDAIKAVVVAREPLPGEDLKWWCFDCEEVDYVEPGPVNEPAGSVVEMAGGDGA